MTVRRLLSQKLESLRRRGVSLVSRKAPVYIEPPATEPAPSVPVEAATAAPQAESATPGAEIAKGPSKPTAANKRPAALAVIAAEVANCTTCSELVANRNNTVFGVGKVNPRVCFLGEAPGQDEDRQGEPFVGRAGQKLNDIIKACGWTRDDVYILNVCKCRPPKNRTPTFAEAEACSGFLQRQLDILRPEYIVCLGSCAAQNLLKTKQAIGKLRGSFHDWQGIRVVATYHPAYLLRNPDARRPVWEDMKMLLKDMGEKVP